MSQFAQGALAYDKRFPGWIAALKHVKVRGAGRRAERHRTLKAEAIADLKQAHASHGKEFYDLTGVGAHLQSHDCAQAVYELDEAKAVGDGAKAAWGEEFYGLLAAEKLLGLHEFVAPEIEPYTDADV